MKFAYQTTSFGTTLPDLQRVLALISACGFTGVEFAQRPDSILQDGRPVEPDHLKSALSCAGLSLVGMGGGQLKERVDFCEGSLNPEYLSVGTWPVTAASAVPSNFSLALHPRMFGAFHRLADLEALLGRHQELRWILDTAHLTAAGDDAVRALTLPNERIAAVHLTDWTSVYGRSSHRYSRGFVELGKGDVDLWGLVEQLLSIDFQGWVVIGGDRFSTRTATKVYRNARWLSDHKLLPRPPAFDTLPTLSAPHPRIPGDEAQTELRFLRAVASSPTVTPSEAYRSIVAALSEQLSNSLVTLWATGHGSSTLTLLAQYPSLPELRRTTIHASQALTGIALERRAMTAFELADNNPGAKFGRPGESFMETRLLSHHHLPGHLLSIPVLSAHNPNHVRFVLNLFHDDEVHPSYSLLGRLASAAERTAESALDEFCSVASTRITRAAGKQRTLRSFLDSLVSIVSASLDCEGVTIFLVNETGEQLEPAATTGLEWTAAVHNRFYARNEGLTGSVWAQQRFLVVTANLLPHADVVRKSKSSETTHSGVSSLLLAPLVNHYGRAIGVVRCCNKMHHSVPEATPFSDDDLAVIDAITQAAVPHIEGLVGEQIRTRALGRFVHELANPIVAVRGNVQWIEQELQDKGLDPRTCFSFDYLDDLWSWTDLLSHLTENNGFVGPRQSALPPAKPTDLIGRIIRPIPKLLTLLLRERGFSSSAISFPAPGDLPMLHVTPGPFRQVFFNLLSNSIKFADPDASRFSVRIRAGRSSSHYVISCQDDGIGIAEGFRESIFEHGVRGPNAAALNVTGQGLGLWVVRSVVESHEGQVSLTNPKHPTEFTIRLPLYLAERPPKSLAVKEASAARGEILVG